MRDAVVRRVWDGDGAAARLAQAALRPAAWAYGTVVAVRNALYDVGWMRSPPLAVPAVSVGNLSVGGTGKTPVSAWIVEELGKRGGHPALVLRGYGSDEPLVHRVLNPDVPVIVDADRARGAATARGRGADVVVFDDAFQHRRAPRNADVVLIAAEGFARSPLLLPAGPYREPLRALRRATVVLVTRKTASVDAARDVARAVQESAPHVPVVIGALALAYLVAVTRQASTDSGNSASLALTALRGRRVLAIAGVARPELVEAQLAAVGAIVELAAYPDHYAYSAASVRTLAARAAAADVVVCTLKDAVKLGPMWPRNAPALWYVSQRLILDSGAEVLDAVLTRLLEARPLTRPIIPAG